MSLEAGQNLSHYRLVEKIGEGGMGVVWKAVDTSLDREAAIKILPPEFAGDEGRLARFEREAKLLASLSHPNIATVHGLFQHQDVRFLAMELVRGEDLSRRLQRGALSVEDTVEVGRQVADALEAAHDHGVIHRDLKPANIILAPDGAAKVLDFGLAKAFEAEAASGDPSLSPTLTTPATAAGVILGTAAYMSPEQARGRPVDRRADIWAYGCVLFECLTGRRCFSGETVTDVLAAVLRADLDWSLLPAGLPPAIQRLLRRCLDRNPRRRLRDIGEARVALEGPLEEPEEAPPPAAARRPIPIAAAAVLLAGLAGIAGWALRAPAPPPLRKFAEPSDLAEGWDTTRPVLSPDGSRVAFLQDGKLWIRDLDDLRPRPVPDSHGAQGVFWSPDGKWIGYSVGSRMWKLEVGGTEPVGIADLAGRASSASGAAWLDDGTILFTTGGSGILSVSSQGGDPVAALEPEADENDFHEVVGLPDGRSILFAVHGSDGTSTIAAFDGRERRTVLELEGQWLRAPAYSPSGHLVFERTSGNSGIWAAPFSLDRLEVTGEPFLVAAHGRSPSVADDGTMVYLLDPTGRRRQLALVDRKGEVIATVGEPQLAMWEPALSPDGRRIAVSAETDGQRDIWIYEIDSGTRSRLTFDTETEDAPRWFPDAERIAFLCGKPEKICIRRADGTGETAEVDAPVSEVLEVSPDGRQIVYGRDGRGTRRDLWLRDLDGEERPLLDSPDFETRPRISRDGRFLAHVAWELGQEEVFLREFPGGAGKWQVSTAGGQYPSWGGDEIFWEVGRALYSRTLTRRPEIRLGPPQLLFRSPALEWGYDPTPDGQRFVLILPVGDDAEGGMVFVQNWFAEFATR